MRGGGAEGEEQYLQATKQPTGQRMHERTAWLQMDALLLFNTLYGMGASLSSVFQAEDTASETPNRLPNADVRSSVK